MNSNGSTSSIDDTIGSSLPAKPDEIPRALDLEIDPPLEWQGETFDVLHLVEPTFKQKRQSQTALNGQGNMYELMDLQHLALISIVTKVPRGALEDLRISQFNEARDFLLHFVNMSGRATGST